MSANCVELGTSLHFHRSSHMGLGAPHALPGAGLLFGTIHWRFPLLGFLSTCQALG